MTRFDCRTGGRAIVRPALLLAALLLLPGTGGAQTRGVHSEASHDLSTKPNPYLPPLGKSRPLHLPPIVQETLPNGLKIVLLEDHTQPALWLRLALPAGTIRDPKEKVGVAEMTAAMLDKGTTTRTQAQIAETIDGIGATLGAGADDDFMTISASGLSAQTDTLFDLLADITLHPTFPQQELERLRTRTLSSLQLAMSQPATLADAALDRLLFPAHPYGNLSSGTATTIPQIATADLSAFHGAYFAPNVATLFLVGDITKDQAVQHAQAVFGSWERKNIPSPPSPPSAAKYASSSAKPTITVIDRPGAAQTEIRIGTRTNGYKDPRRVVGSVATTVLGLGQFEGRLTKEIRVKRGLTYGAASSIARRSQAGKFEISTFTKNKSTGQVVQIALAEARKLCRELTPAPELQARKDFLKGYFAVSVATPPGVLQRLIPAVLNGEGPDELTKYTGRVQAVTPRQIQEVMSDLIAQPIQVVLVGDAKAIASQVRPLGNIRTIPSSSVDLLSPTLQATRPKSGGAGAAPKAEDAAEGKARLAATVQAHGGDAFLNLKQLVMKGKGELTPPGEQNGLKLPLETVTLTSVTPDKSRLEMKTTLGDIIIASPGNGAVGWMQAMGRVQDSPQDVSGGDPTDLLRRAVRKNYAVYALPDKENGKPITASDGRTLQGFAVVDEKGKTTQVYVDAETHLIRRLVLQEPTVPVSVLLADYHATDGVQMPGTIQVLQNNSLYLTLNFDSVQINPPVDESLFARPKS